MGGPWRERGFDPASLRSSRPHRGARAEALAQEPGQARLNKIVLTFIAAIVMSFGLLVSLLQRGW
jgi:hypothetical protein